MKDFLLTRFSETAMEVGKGGFAWDAIIGNADKASEMLSAKMIAQKKTKILNSRNSLKVTEQIEKKERDGIVARPSECGIGDCCNGANEREINGRTNQLSAAAWNGVSIIDRDGVLSDFVMGKPTRLPLRKGFYIKAIDKFIAFEKIFDRMACSEESVFAHVKTIGVSREDVPPSKTLPEGLF
jgi:hypothetical protein